MSEQEKISLIEEAMNLEKNSLKLNDVLESFSEWDSLSFLSLIAIVDEKLKKTLEGSQLRQCKTVKDVIALF